MSAAAISLRRRPPLAKPKQSRARLRRSSRLSSVAQITIAFDSRISCEERLSGLGQLRDSFIDRASFGVVNDGLAAKGL